MSSTIRQRILTQAKATVEGIAGIGTVRHWDARGTATYANLDAIIAPLDSETKEDLGLAGGIECKLTILVAVVLFPDESGSDSSTVLNTWIGKLANAFLANRFFAESVGGVQLAIDSMPFEHDGANWVDGATEATIRVVITYRHDSTNVFAYSGAIAEA